MKPHLAPSDGPDLLAPAVDDELSVLASFAWVKLEELQRLRAHRPRVRILVDSGAFSVASGTASVELSRYASFLRRASGVVDEYVNLDVIGDRTRTLRNHLALEREGLRPWPVVHYPTDPATIARWVDRGYPTVMLGGLVPHAASASRALVAGRDDPVLQWLNECAFVADDFGIALHGLGVTPIPLIREFSWRSVDSAYWAVKAKRFGYLALYDAVADEVVGMRANAPGELLRRGALLQRYGLTVAEVTRDRPERWWAIRGGAARSWLAIQRATGVRVYLAAGSWDDLDLLLRACASEVEHGHRASSHS